MDIKIENREKGVLLSIAGRLDATTATELDTKFGELLEADNKNVIVSMEDLEYLSSAGLRVILLFAKRLHADKRKICFATLSGNVKAVFDISGFYSIFDIYDTVAEAFTA